MSNQQALSISYQNQNNWKEIQSFLPLRYQLTDASDAQRRKLGMAR